MDRSRLSSPQRGTAGSSGNGVFSGTPSGNMGGGNMGYQQVQQMFEAMMGMMNVKKDKEREREKESRDQGGNGRVVLDEKYFWRREFLMGTGLDSDIGCLTSMWPLGLLIKT